MAFDLTAVRDGVSYSLTAGTPFKLAHAAGLFWPEVNRVTLRAPTQDGDVDYGAYLSPRLITLSVHFYATSGSALDGYRDTFYRIFRPSRSTGSFDNLGDSRFAAQSPITLQVTRDDAVVRRSACMRRGRLTLRWSASMGRATCTGLSCNWSRPTRRGSARRRRRGALVGLGLLPLYRATSFTMASITRILSSR
jgi:hypothetical protein